MTLVEPSKNWNPVHVKLYELSRNAKLACIEYKAILQITLCYMRILQISCEKDGFLTVKMQVNVQEADMY